MSKRIDTGTVKRVAKYALKYKWKLALSLLSAVVSVVFTLLIPVIIGRAIDCLIGVDRVDFTAMSLWLIALAVSVIIVAVTQWILLNLTNTIANKVARNLRNEAFEHLNTLPLKYADRNAHGNIMARLVSDIEIINEGFIQCVRQLFTGVLTIVATIGFMFAINWVIALVVIVLTPLSLLLAAFIAKKSNKLFLKQMNERGELTGLVDEMIGGQRVVQAFGYEQEAEERFDEINMRMYSSGIKSQFISAIGNPATRFVNGLIYAAVGVVGAFSVLGMVGDAMTVGQLSSFLAYANQYTKPFNEISSVVTEIQSAVASASRVFSLIDEPSESSDIGKIDEFNAKGEVELREVSFSYDKDRPLINGLNLTAKAGERIAIVGTTGSGKTTIINLLMRFYDVDSGEIFIDGVNINDLTRRALRSQFGMVLQDTWLFKGTIRDNISYSMPNATDEEIISASKAAYAHGFISQLKDGYDTVLDETNTLSEGQKQLLNIARIMLMSPPMLILDEATSNIDTLTEIKLQRALEKMQNGRTSFIVAHRLSTIKNADKIVVMDNGRIVESGTHDELLKLNKVYAELYKSQYMTSETEIKSIKNIGDKPQLNL